MKPGLLSRRELPKWVTPMPQLPASWFAVFFATEGGVREYLFGTEGGLCHVGTGLHICGRRVFRGSMPPTGPEVWIAAGVEAMRRRGAGA